MLRLFSILVLLVSGSAAMAVSMTEEQKINALLDSFDTPGVTFVRNGEEHDGAWAKKHLAEKLSEKKAEVKTANDFITKVATSSRETGKPYMVKKDGKTVESATWLQGKLADMSQPAAGTKENSTKQ